MAYYNILTNAWDAPSSKALSFRTNGYESPLEHLGRLAQWLPYEGGYIIIATIPCDDEPLYEVTYHVHQNMGRLRKVVISY